MDPLDLITDAKLQAQILFALTALSMLLPGLQWVADRTANTWDNALLARISWLLSRIPRLKMGLGNTQQASATVARTSVKPPPLPPLERLMLVLYPAMVLAAGVHIVTLLGCGAQQAATDARKAVEQMRAESTARAAEFRKSLATARTALDLATGATLMACNFRRVPQCDVAEDSIRALDAAHKTASTAVDAMERSGLVLETVARQVEGASEQVEALGATITALEEAVHAVDQRPDSSSAGLVPQQPAESPAGAAPAGAP